MTPTQNEEAVEVYDKTFDEFYMTTSTETTARIVNILQLRGIDLGNSLGEKSLLLPTWTSSLLKLILRLRKVVNSENIFEKIVVELIKFSDDKIEAVQMFNVESNSNVVTELVFNNLKMFSEITKLSV